MNNKNKMIGVLLRVDIMLLCGTLIVELAAASLPILRRDFIRRKTLEAFAEGIRSHSVGEDARFIWTDIELYHGITMPSEFRYLSQDENGNMVFDHEMENLAKTISPYL